MRQILLTLYQLQELDDRLHEMKTKQERLQELKQEGDEVLENLDGLLQEQTERLENSKLLRDARKSEADELKERTKRTRLRAMQISTERELTAINKERDRSEQLQKGKREEIEQLEQRITEEEGLLDERRAQRDQLAEKIQQTIKTEQQELKALQEPAESLIQWRAELWEQLPLPHQEGYERLWSTRKELAVVGVSYDPDERSYHCQGCNLQIRPSIFQDLLKGDQIKKCEACNRYLGYVAHVRRGKMKGEIFCSGCDAPVSESENGGSAQWRCDTCGRHLIDFQIDD